MFYPGRFIAAGTSFPLISIRLSWPTLRSEVTPYFADRHFVAQVVTLVLMVCLVGWSATSSMAIDIGATRKTGGNWGDPAPEAWEFSTDPPSGRTFPNNLESPSNPENYSVDLGDFLVALGPISGGVFISDLSIGSKGGLNIDQTDDLFLDAGGEITFKEPDPEAPGEVGTILIDGPNSFLIIFHGDVTLNGEGTIRIADTDPRPNVSAGLTGQSNDSRLINSGSKIAGYGLIGRDRLSVVNRGTIVADEAGKSLLFDPGSGTAEHPGEIRNEEGGTLLAIGGGRLVLTGGLFNNDGGTIRAEENSQVILANGADVRGGSLEATGSGRFQTTAAQSTSFLSSVNLTSGVLEVRDKHTLKLSGTITDSGEIALRGIGGRTSLEIDGTVELEGRGKVTLVDESFDRIVGTNASSRLINGSGHAIEGAGRFGFQNLVIENSGTVSANLFGKSLLLEPTVGSTLINNGVLEARNVAFLDAFNHTIDNRMGTLRVVDNAVVTLFNVAVIGGLLTSTEDSGAPSLTGVFKVRGNGSVFDGRPFALINDAQVDVTDATLTLKGIIQNRDTISLNNGPARTTAALNVMGGDVELTGSGNILLSDDPTNIISQPTGESTHTLINFDNTIEGAGNIGNDRLNIKNQSGGTIRANVTNPLIIDPPADVEAVNEGTFEAVKNATLVLKPGMYRNASGAKMQAIGPSTLRVEGGSLINQATVESQGEGGASVVIQGTAVINTGRLAATGGGVMQLRAATIANSSGQSEGTIAAGDTSLVELSDGTIISGGRLITSTNGNIQIVNRAAIVAPATNQGNLVITNGATASLVGGDTNTLEGRLAFTNTGTIVLDGRNEPSVAKNTVLLVVGPAKLVGGGIIEMSDSPNNRIIGSRNFFPISLPVSELVNEDNTIRGAGEIHSSITENRVLFFFNGPGGRVIATGKHPLVIRVGFPHTVSFLGLPTDTIETPFNEGLLHAQGSGGMKLVTLANALDNNGTILVDKLSRLEVDVGQRFHNLGAITINGLLNSVRGMFINGETDDLARSDEPSLTINGIATLESTFEHRSGTTIINGTLSAGSISVGNKGVVDIHGKVDTGKLTLGDSGRGILTQIAPTSEVTVHGDLSQFGGSTLVDGTIIAEKLDVIAGSLAVNGSVTISLGDRFVRLRKGANLSGSGTINGRLITNGRLAPGKSPGVLTVIGSFEQMAGGEVEIELAGVQAGSEYDQLIVDGRVVLDGTVVVKHLDGFAPDLGSDFDVVSATTLVDNGFSLAMVDGGLVRPGMLDLGDGTTALRLTSIQGVRYAQVSGSWDDAANWTDDTLPGADDTALVAGDPLADTIVTGPAAGSTVFSLVIGSGDEAATSSTSLELGAGTITTTRGTTLRRDGQLIGDGTLGGNLYNAGTVAPGNGPGTINLTGDFNQNEDGKLTIELGGTAPGDQFDQLTIGGNASLDGTLDVQLIDLGEGVFAPDFGDVFTILTADVEVHGQFAAVHLPPLAEQFAWIVDYLSSSVELTAGLAGDYNRNGIIDAADYTVWREFVGHEGIGLAADGDANGLIDQADYDLWKMHFGHSSLGSNSRAHATVPESTTAAMLLAAICCAILQRCGPPFRGKRTTVFVP